MANVNGSKVASPPRLIYSLIEGRAFLEMALLPALLPVLSTTPRGDGHPVLLVPGFTAGDATMVGLKLFLQSRGYGLSVALSVVCGAARADEDPDT